MTRAKDANRPHPLVLEVNARLWSQRPDREAELDSWAAHFDLVWLMGLWSRSPAARVEALSHPGLEGEYTRALGTWSDSDVAASPYAIVDYRVDPELGVDIGAVRDRLHRAGVGLIADFVPNHVARDHRWTREHPEWLIADTSDQPGHGFVTPGGCRLAHGRDPYHPPWTDTAQIDISAPGARRALIAELERIAEIADGVRCDMAMLVLSDVFAETWGKRPGEELWAEAIDAVRRRRPDFLFIAEAYWGLEPRLIQLGFDHVYDKDLYDRLRWRPGEVREHLAGAGWLERAVHFVENHDEDRAPEAFGDRARAAAVCALTIPGMRLVFDGQRRGRRRRLPVQLVREPDEQVDHDLERFYGRLLLALDHPVFHQGSWRLLPPAHPIVAWCWAGGGAARVVAVNLSAGRARATVGLPVELGDAESWQDLLDPDRAALDGEGALEIDLPAWGAAIFEAV